MAVQRRGALPHTVDYRNPKSLAGLHKMHPNLQPRPDNRTEKAAPKWKSDRHPTEGMLLYKYLQLR